MLSTNSTSSVQKRRQLHRRQQSLEVPVLAHPHPAALRHTHKPAAHRRGLSLDQSLSAARDSPSGFRPLPPQDPNQDQDPNEQPFPGTPPVRIHLDTTNIGHPPDPQHFVQETQQHRPAQPGFQAPDFQSHLQQQLKGPVNTPPIIAPIPTHPNQEQALQDLQHHLEWYQQNFGHSPSPQPPPIQSAPPFIIQQQLPDEMVIRAIDAPVPIMLPMAPQTPVSHGHPHTMPNTPQQFVRNWPSPPATDVKHMRSHSFQVDVAPMPLAFDSANQSIKGGSPYVQPHDSFTQDPLGYASSAYSSSNVDPMSPGRQYNIHGMPTLFEEPHDHPHDLDADDVLLQATGGESHDFNSPNFVFGMGMSPHSAMLHNLGEDVNATIVDTGIPSEEVDMNISQQNEKTKWWYCLYELENGKKCGKPFKRKENARSHVQNHMGDRQFQCNDCGKTFVRQHDMKRHAAIHKEDRPHVCPCGSKFARHDALTRHRQRGMCKGTLPGYERSEEDKPKRGRPKKDRRPDQKARVARATKARQMDRANAEAHGGAEINYASPNSSGSEHSLPMTPPDTSDFDTDAFVNMVTVEMTDYPERDMLTSYQQHWRDTPPTSPASASQSHSHSHKHNHVKTISPAMLNNQSFTGGSSPLSQHYGDFGPPVDSQPDALFGQPMSPEYGSTNASSPFNADEPVEVRDVNWGSLLDKDDQQLFGGAVGNANKEPEVGVTLGPMLNQWLALH